MQSMRDPNSPAGARDRDVSSSGVGGAVSSVRARIVSGILFVSPIIITFWIVIWLYRTLDHYVIDPVASVVHQAIFGAHKEAVNVVELVAPDGFKYQVIAEDPEAITMPFFDTYVAPAIALGLVILLLYLIGLFVRTRMRQFVDWTLLRLPVVTVVYNAVRNVFQSIEAQGQMSQFKRVVLVAFPHPGMRVPGFVTSTCRDAKTGKRILCIYIPTTPVPTSGYMLLVPEEEVTELDWSLEQTLQAVVSGGISVPESVAYFPAPP
jgi:uncharacterized membrane protein